MPSTSNPNPQTSAATQGLTFFDLPTEIRNEIYTLALIPNPRAHPAKAGKVASLLHTSRQVRSEAAPIYYNLTPFLLDLIPHRIRGAARARAQARFDWLGDQAPNLPLALKNITFQYVDTRSHRGGAVLYKRTPASLSLQVSLPRAHALGPLGGWGTCAWDINVDAVRQVQYIVEEFREGEGKQTALSAEGWMEIVEYLDGLREERVLVPRRLYDSDDEESSGTEDEDEDGDADEDEDEHEDEHEDD